MKSKLSSISRISGMYRHNQSASFAIASEVFLGLGSDLGKKCESLLRSNDHTSLLELTAKPSSYSCADKFRDDYLCSELLSKYPYLDIEVDRERVALQKFIDSEQQCSTAARRLESKVPGSIFSPYTPLSIISIAKLKIASLLGSFSWDSAEQHFSFGPGSTTSLPRRNGDAYYKFGAVRPHVTEACSVLGLLAIKQVPRWFFHLAGLAGEIPEDVNKLPLTEQVNRLLTIVPGNRVTTVPKNAKTDRVIAIEPDLNMYIQKGIGALIRSRLRRVGVDLNDQTRNQILACEGSITGSLATLDLSSASDTVSMRLVEELLPDDWCSALKLCRSPRGVLPNGEILTYHKVSSMGNGFTFELESLIFWALCSAVITLLKPEESRLAVYGDDIIISSSIYGTVSWILTYCGFTVNAKKSFSDGPFRESCGKHFFNGVDVTPFYIREDIKSPDRLIWAANSIRRWARLTWGLDGRLYQAYSYAVRALPPQLRKTSIPDGLGDIALIGDFDESTPSRCERFQCWYAVGVSDIRDTRVPGEIPYLLRQLRNMELLPIYRSLVESKGVARKSGITTNHLKRSWKLVKVPITLWESYGPWLGT